jgi:hypothetical protein
LNIVVKLTTEERTAYGQELAQQLGEVGSLQAELKEARDDIRSRLQPIQARVDHLAGALRGGQEFRDVECDVVYDWAAGEYRAYAATTGELLQRRSLSGTERQMSIGSEPQDESPPDRPEPPVLAPGTEAPPPVEVAPETPVGVEVCDRVMIDLILNKEYELHDQVKGLGKAAVVKACEAFSALTADVQKEQATWYLETPDGRSVELLEFVTQWHEALRDMAARGKGRNRFSAYLASLSQPRSPEKPSRKPNRKKSRRAAEAGA